MLIHCPHCATEFETASDQIEAAAGMTHCVRCHHVFEIQADTAAAAALPTPTTASPAEPVRQRRHGAAGWFLGSSALLLLLAAQLAWYHQDALLHHPQVRALAEAACAQFDCRLPPLSAPQQIQILKREIKLHPAHTDTLRLELVMLNAAAFTQPYPVLELSLLDTEQHVVARRRFRPAEYLNPPANAQAGMAPKRAHYVEMDLRAPANAVGFHINFL